MTTKHVNSILNINNAERLFANMQSTNNTYYVFIGNPLPTPNDNIATNIVATDYLLTKDYYNYMIAGKRIANTNITRMVKRNNWQSGQPYQFYDHRVSNLANTKFYVSVDSGSDIKVFKCIWNNYGANSTINPGTIPEGLLANVSSFETSDGYKWKWMYTVQSANTQKFAPGLSEFIPIEPNQNVVSNAVSGSILHFVVESGGAGYNSYTNGTFSAIDVGGNNQIHQLQIETASPNTDFYKGCSVKIVAGPGSGEQRKIQEYIGASRRIVLDSAFVITPTIQSQYVIAPSVTVDGDGQGLRAIAVVNAQSNTISGVEVSNSGSGYSWTSVTVEGNTGIILSNSVVQPVFANVAAIISPPGGHGANPYNELYSEYIGISIDFANNESNQITTDNDFHTIGIMRDPLFANVVFGAANVVGSFSVGETIQQQNTFASAFVVGYTANALQVSNCQGRFETGNSSFGVIRGQTSNATCEVANIQNNGVVKQFDTFNQTTRMTIASVTGQFVEDELIEQSVLGVVIANGYVHGANSTHISAVNTKKTFQVSSISQNYQLVGNTSGATGNVTIVVPPDIVPYTGELLYIENIIPVSRSNTQTETLRFVFKL
jgi:hypothetical protein